MKKKKGVQSSKKMCERTTEIEKQVFFALFWLASIFWLSVVRSTELLGMESAERESVANMSNDTYTRRLSDRSQNRFIWGIWDFLDLPKKDGIFREHLKYYFFETFKSFKGQRTDA